MLPRELPHRVADSIRRPKRLRVVVPNPLPASGSDTNLPWAVLIPTQRVRRCLGFDNDGQPLQGQNDIDLPGAELDICKNDGVASVTRQEFDQALKHGPVGSVLYEGADIKLYISHLAPEGRAIGSRCLSDGVNGRNTVGDGS